MSFKPMLAAKAATVELTLQQLKFPVLASPKLDGIRCVMHNHQALSRSLKPIQNKYIQRVLQDFYPHIEHLDGELIVGDPWHINVMQATSSGVMSRDGKPDFTYYVFDHTAHSSDYARRYQQVQMMTHALGNIQVQLVKHHYITNLAELLEFEDSVLEQGYEGIITRRPDSQYKLNRSTMREQGMVKIKRFEDAEATVIGFKERMHNANEAFTNELGRTARSTAQAGKTGLGTLGAFVCVTPEGVQFDVGSGAGLTDVLRQKLWDEREHLVGKLLKYKSFKIGEKDKPRHPLWLGFRDPSDM